jgi:hypothetical protein
VPDCSCDLSARTFSLRTSGDFNASVSSLPTLVPLSDESVWLVWLALARATWDEGFSVCDPEIVAPGFKSILMLLLSPFSPAAVLSTGN